MRLNGLDFHVESDGRGPGHLLLLHGFTGSVRAWDAVRPALAQVTQVISVDLIGHGRSAAPADTCRYSLDWAARDLLALLDGLGIARAHVLGYSMGGRVALHLACRAPQRVQRLILESASPGIEDRLERSRRIASDAALAERILRDGLPAFVAEWEHQPLLQPAPHVTPDARARQRSQRLDNDPGGLANSLLGMGAGQQLPLWSTLPNLHLPVLLIVGQRDAKYERMATRMRSLLPAAELSVVEQAGHSVHLDQPRRFAELVVAALGSPGGG